MPSAAFRYVKQVHRLGVGDRLEVFDPESATEADAEVVAVSRRDVRCRIEAVRPSAHRPTRSVTLVQGMGKADKPDRVVRDATALGATRIVFVDCARATVRLGDRADDRVARWRRIAVESARQCGRGDIPEVAGPVPFASALEDRPPETSLRVSLDPRASVPLADVLAAASGRLAVAALVGPEGGFTDAELAMADAVGFRRATIGEFVLRTETAATAVLGAIAAGW